MNEKLEKLRVKIDETDGKITSLLEERLNLVKEIGIVKINNNIPVIDSKRANSVVEKAIERIENKQYSGEIAETFTHIITISEEMQRRLMNEKLNANYAQSILDSSLEFKKFDENLKVAYQGIKGAFSHEALIKYFGNEPTACPCYDFEDVFSHVDDATADYGVLPIENSCAGSVVEIYDLFRKYSAYIVGEIKVNAVQNLLGVKGATTQTIKTIYSHPQGIMQCKDFLKNHKDITPVALSNTAVSAKYVSHENDITKGAIASEYAAKEYNLDILDSQINTNEINVTKFIIIARKPSITKNSNKISLLFTLPNVSGALCRVMLIFSKHNLNMSKIESRPMESKQFEYFFYSDITGNMNDENVKNALNELKASTGYMEILGNY